MTEIELPSENITKNKKLYSSKAISGATFLGGPLAAGYLISENFKALDKPDDGRKSLIIGIITTIILFGGIFMIPESIIDIIPNQIIPLIYTGFIWGFVEWNQGSILKAHRENGNSFFSGWRAAGIGLISLIITGIGILGYAYIEASNPAYDTYDNKMEDFFKNETESLTFFDNINTKSNSILLGELDSNVIPKWERNIDIIKELNAIENLPSDLLYRNKGLLKYSELRLEAFRLIKKIIIEETDKYDSQLNTLNLKIDLELEKLN